MSDFDKQEADWRQFFDREVELGRCPFSGLMITECKNWLCDCLGQVPG